MMAWRQPNPQNLGRIRSRRVTACGVPALCIAVTLMAEALAGCGSSAQTPSEHQVTNVVRTLQSLSRAGKADQICTQIFTSAEAQAIARNSGTSCAKQVTQQLVSASTTFTIKSVRINGRQALVTVIEGNGNHTGLYLIRQSGAWRINSITAIR
jgi:hypothetical protein